MRLINTLKNPKYAGIFIISAVFIFSLYVYTQVLGIVENIDIWFATAPWYNIAMLIIFSLLFGAFVSYQIYVWKSPKTCPTHKKIISSGSSGVGVITAFLTSQCAACLSLATLLLPISIVGFFITYNWVMNLLSIALILISLKHIGAFEKE